MPPNTVLGTVKAWIEDRGMGFLTPDDDGEDVFVHRSDLIDGEWLSMGAPVSFERGFDQQKQKVIARRVTGASSASVKGAGKGMASGALQTGVVKLWFEDKAFGFIVPDGGGADVMVHKNEVADSLMMQPGQAVSFEAVWEPQKNKFKATKCIPANGPPANFNGPPVDSYHNYPRDAPASTMTDTIYVSGLPNDINDHRLREIFSQYGSVAALEIHGNIGRSDLSALVTMFDTSLAQWLVENLNGNIPVGMAQPVTVEFAAPPAAQQQQQAPQGSYGKAYGGKGAHPDSNSPYGGARQPQPPPPPPRSAWQQAGPVGHHAQAPPVNSAFAGGPGAPMNGWG